MDTNTLKQLRQSNIFLESGKINNNAKKIISNREHLQKLILISTPFISGELLDTLNERLYCIDNNIKQLPVCGTCGGEVKFVGKKYQAYCCKKCANSNSERLNQIKLTNQKKYGGPAPMCSDRIKAKAVSTNLEKYGAKYHQLSQQGKSVRAQTNLTKYGHECVLLSSGVQKKIRSSMIVKFGDTNFNRSQLSDYALSKLEDINWLKSMHHDKKLPVYEIANMLEVSTFCVRSYFDTHNINIKRFHESLQQKQIQNFISTLIPDAVIKTNDRTVIAPLELDIIIPSRRLAFEVNGVYWHSELNGKSRNYHKTKTEQCFANGIRLIHITDQEWIKKPEIVKSRIRTLLKQSNRIYARKCSVVELSHKKAKDFFDETHIQGYTPSSVTYGLIYDHQIVAAMSFGKARYNPKFEWELLRFSSKLDHNVVGGASKLFKRFVTAVNPKSIISYADLRWNTGQVYEKLGFEFQHVSAPNYYYFHINNPHKLYHRTNFQKHKLLGKMSYYNPELSGWENMQANNYDRIWDCGNSVWGWTQS